MKYTILQLDTDNPNVLRDHKLFEDWDMLNKTAGFNIHQYKKVYEGEVEDQEVSIRPLTISLRSSTSITRKTSGVIPSLYLM